MNEEAFLRIRNKMAEEIATLRVKLKEAEERGAREMAIAWISVADLINGAVFKVNSDSSRTMLEHVECMMAIWREGREKK
jgi:hypothetical protein